MVKFIENLFGSGKKKKKPKSEAEEYEELNLSEFEEGFKDEPTNMLVRVAELNGPWHNAWIKETDLWGNVVFIDVSPAKHDKLLFDRAIKDLKQVVNDVHGDIALVKEDQVIVTPRGVRIDRQKLKWSGILPTLTVTRSSCPLCPGELKNELGPRTIALFWRSDAHHFYLRVRVQYSDTADPFPAWAGALWNEGQVNWRPGCKGSTLNVWNYTHTWTRGRDETGPARIFISNVEGVLERVEEILGMGRGGEKKIGRTLWNSCPILKKRGQESMRLRLWSMTLWVTAQ